MNNHIVIMAGGIGSRFWPLSTPEFPKQFIDILGCGRTLIQLTVDRFKGLCPMENFWVVTNAAYVDIVRQQLPEMPVNHILAEPAARNTAPCIAWACWRIKAEDPEANVVVTPADAVVMNPEEFRRVIGNALNFTEKSDAIVTIGIKPNLTYDDPILVYPTQAPRARALVKVKAPRGGEYELYNSTGLIISRGQLISGENELTLPATSGIYFIRTKQGDEVKSHKVLIY